MPYTDQFEKIEPTRDAIDASAAPTVLEFGVDWCPHCQRAQPFIETALAAHPEVSHIKIEDGSGRRLGRSFRVKLWPTLIFVKAGKEVARVVRPVDSTSIERALGAFGAVKDA